jgi:hypothetical protein
MNGYQIFVSLFGLISLSISIVAIWCVAKSDMGYKPAWIIGCLFGFVGFGLNWSKPDDLILLLGVQIPPVMASTIFPTGIWIVKTQFPVIAVVALGKSQFHDRERSDD